MPLPEFTNEDIERWYNGQPLQVQASIHTATRAELDKFHKKYVDVWKETMHRLIRQHLSETRVLEIPHAYAVQCFLDGERKLSHELTAVEAHHFRQAARHLSKYLTEAYKLSQNPSERA